MTTPTIAFFNNKGGGGKTSLVYHVAWMFSDLGVRAVAADVDPQANLTTAFLDEDQLDELWDDPSHPRTVYDAVRPLLDGTGDINIPPLEEITENLGLLVGDLALSSFEDELSAEWPACLDRRERAFRVISAFWRIQQGAAQAMDADVVLMDLGPNLGAINRAALIAADHVVVPLSPDLFSLRGLQNLGPTVRNWRDEWHERQERDPGAVPLPDGTMAPAGYVVLQHAMRLDRPVRAYERWMNRIPGEYSESVLDESAQPGLDSRDDPHCLALLKHYRSLMPMAQEARKPLFHLKAADGAVGAHFKAVQDAYADFEALTRTIANRTGVALEE